MTELFALGVQAPDGTMHIIAVTRELAICEALARLLAHVGEVAACRPVVPGAAL